MKRVPSWVWWATGFVVAFLVLATFAHGQGAPSTSNYPTSGGAPFAGGATAGTSYQDVTETAAPANPAAGVERIYSDSTSHILTCLTSGGGNCFASTAPSYPVTVGGTVTSGGIPCFTGTTTEASSALLTGSTLIKGGGAGVCPSSSSVLEGATIVSTVKAFKAGTAAGIVGFSDLTIGMTTAAMSAQTTATCTNVTGMTWNLLSVGKYILSCEIPVTFAATATLQFCLGGPGTATSWSLEDDGPIGAAGAYAQGSILAQTAWGGTTTASGAPGATEWVHVRGTIRNGATASGTALTLQTAANGTNAITVLQDASCVLTGAN